jgi:hypothetical protein
MQFFFNKAPAASEIEAGDEFSQLFCALCMTMMDESIPLPAVVTHACSERFLSVLTPFINIEGRLMKRIRPTGLQAKWQVDLHDCPDYVVPLAVLAAGCSLEADFTGLQLYGSSSRMPILVDLQRVLYRLNVLTDFCGGAKLKIYNTRKLKYSEDRLQVCPIFPFEFLIPLTLKTGCLELQADQRRLQKVTPLMNSWGIRVETES